MLEITYKPESDNKCMHLTQRNTRGGSIGDVVILRAGETAEVTLEADGVQITAVEMANVPPAMKPADDVTPSADEEESE
jgi:hypothetical protein